MPTFLQDKMLSWALAGVAFLVAIVLIFKIIEILVDLRRRMPSSARSRQLRLGFVETYDLDGERQLLLVRRDNVEHLLMVGGPNDVLVESGIVRVEPREARAPRATESGAPSAALAPPPAPAPVAPPAPDLAAAIEAALAAPEPEPVYQPAPSTPAAAPPPPPEALEPPPPPRDSLPPLRPQRDEPARSAAPSERATPRFPLPPKIGSTIGSPAGPARQLGPLPPPRFTPQGSTGTVSIGTGAGSRGEEQPPRPRFVMPPIARRATPVASNPPPPPAVAPEPPPSDVAPPAFVPPHGFVPPLGFIIPTPPREPDFESDSEPPSSPVLEPPSHASSVEPPLAPVEPPGALIEPPGAQVEAPVEPTPAPPKPQNFDIDFEPLESLEEEMAKLLGRPINK
jgi:hypothetical protein